MFMGSIDGCGGRSVPPVYLSMGCGAGVWVRWWVLGWELCRSHWIGELSFIILCFKFFGWEAWGLEEEWESVNKVSLTGTASGRNGPLRLSRAFTLDGFWGGMLESICFGGRGSNSIECKA